VLLHILPKERNRDKSKKKLLLHPQASAVSRPGENESGLAPLRSAFDAAIRSVAFALVPAPSK